VGRDGRCRGGFPADGNSAALTARIAVGPHQGQKALTLQTGPARAEAERDAGRLVNAAGFSLHCGVAAAAHQRANLERLCRYISRPALATERFSLTGQGNIRYRLKTPYRDGTTDVIFELLDFIARLASRCQKRVNGWWSSWYFEYLKGDDATSALGRKRPVTKALF
jgi:hypothetical protein